MSTNFIDTAKVMSKGRVTFIVDGSNVRLVNSAVYAKEIFQESMKVQQRKRDYHPL